MLEYFILYNLWDYFVNNCHVIKEVRYEHVFITDNKMLF